MREVLIVGQGLAGTWLSWWLHRAGVTFRLIDNPDRGGASIRAAGLVNPITGRRLVTTWMIDELMPFAFLSYGELGNFLNESFIQEVSLIDLFPSVQMLQAFQKRMEEEKAYLYPGEDREKYLTWFRYDLGWGRVGPCALVNVENMLARWRIWLKKKESLIESVLKFTDLHIEDPGIEYSGERYRYIIFCDGESSAHSPFFNKLPFALNKGEGLLLAIDGLPGGLVFKKGMSLVPFRENIYWLGSSYEWTFDDNQPTANFRKTAETWLNYNLKLPYTILEHFAAIRPATLERRPFIGFHPLYPQIGILNGLGTKGCSLAPFFAKQMVNKLTGEGGIDPLADIKRFENILRRT
ncbi:MAG TPA: FAD-dependent oxidoreductase [Puia sp.]|nr:FAD-dependent oxidoreductase [Puia sp.]